MNAFKTYDEDNEFVERFLARTAMFENLLLEEDVLDRVKSLGYCGVMFSLRSREAFANIGGIIGCGRTPSAALADALSKIYVPEVQS